MVQGDALTKSGARSRAHLFPSVEENSCIPRTCFQRKTHFEHPLGSNMNSRIVIVVRCRKSFIENSFCHQLVNDVLDTCAVDLLSEVDGITICSHGLEELLGTRNLGVLIR
mgnify:CR=1 FL=1